MDIFITVIYSDVKTFSYFSLHSKIYDGLVYLQSNRLNCSPDILMSLFFGIYQYGGLLDFANVSTTNASIKALNGLYESLTNILGNKYKIIRIFLTQNTIRSLLNQRKQSQHPCVSKRKHQQSITQTLKIAWCTSHFIFWRLASTHKSYLVKNTPKQEAQRAYDVKHKSMKDIFNNWLH